MIPPSGRLSAGPSDGEPAVQSRLCNSSAGRRVSFLRISMPVRFRSVIHCYFELLRSNSAPIFSAPGPIKASPLRVESVPPRRGLSFSGAFLCGFPACQPAPSLCFPVLLLLLVQSNQVHIEFGPFPLLCLACQLGALPVLRGASPMLGLQRGSFPLPCASMQIRFCAKHISAFEEIGAFPQPISAVLLASIAMHSPANLFHFQASPLWRHAISLRIKSEPILRLPMPCPGISGSFHSYSVRSRPITSSSLLCGSEPFLGCSPRGFSIASRI